MTLKQSLYFPVLALLSGWTMFVMVNPFMLDYFTWQWRIVVLSADFASFALIPWACSKLDKLEGWLSK